MGRSEILEVELVGNSDDRFFLFLAVSIALEAFASESGQWRQISLHSRTSACPGCPLNTPTHSGT